MDNDHLHIDLLVYEDVRKVKVGQEVVFHLSGQPEELSVLEFCGGKVL